MQIQETVDQKQEQNVKCLQLVRCLQLINYSVLLATNHSELLMASNYLFAGASVESVCLALFDSLATGS